MTTATDFVVLLAGLLRRGVKFKLIDGGAGVRMIPGPGCVSDAEVAELRRAKPTLIQLLKVLEATGGRLVHPARFTRMDEDGRWN